MTSETLIGAYADTQKEILSPDATISTQAPKSWDELLLRYKDNIRLIDLRLVDNNLAMSAVMGDLRYLPEEAAMCFVLHTQLPVSFLTSLEDKKLDYHIKVAGEGEVNLLIFKTLHK